MKILKTKSDMAQIQIEFYKITGFVLVTVVVQQITVTLIGVKQLFIMLMAPVGQEFRKGTKKNGLSLLHNVWVSAGRLQTSGLEISAGSFSFMSDG